MTADPDESGGFVPRPPKARSATDFIVITFVVLVASVIFALTLATIATALFTDDEVGPFLAILTDLMASIIAALVGFLAGRGVAQSEQRGPP